MQRVIYQTTRTIKNPLGDGRHDRAPYRSALEKSVIPAGFVFGIDENGNVSDHSVPKFEVADRFAGQLRDLLLQNCTRPLGFGEEIQTEPATVKEAIAKFGGPEVVAEALCEALGIKANDLQELMVKVAQPAAASAPKTKGGKGSKAEARQ